MDISLNWLNRYVKIDDITPEELAAKITSVGLEVEGMHELAFGTNLVVGYVHECEMHPDSDHLHVCQVEIKPGEITQIVCGAPNVDKGQKVIVALPGCELHGGTIKNSKIRGVESNGMICSLSELGIDARFQTEEQKAGIEILPADAPIGEEALSYMGLKDTILEIGLTPNRADCLAVKSLAYEVAAVLNRDLKLEEITTKGISGSNIEVAIESDLCTYFGAKLVKGVKTKESPQWLKSTLMASGIKPINNIVDISNYVMLETGQPIHMYDYDKLQEKKFTIKTGMEMTTTLLDGQEYNIIPTDLIVSTDNKVGCIAGVMGDDSTKIDENTTNIVIEVATFNGACLRATAKRLNLLTDASSRFIKNALDTKSSPLILERCANLLEELADATEIYETVSSSTVDMDADLYVDLRTSRVNELCGTNVTDEIVHDIFTRLRFNYTFENGVFHVLVPSYRNDITMEADLVEEVARMYGYDNIPSTLPTMPMTSGRLTPSQARVREIRHALSKAGLHEAVTYTLTSPNYVSDFNTFHTTEPVALMSPLSEERSVTRSSLIPSLLQVIAYNNAHSQKDVHLYEIARTYSKDEEIHQIAIAMSGIYHETKWQQTTKNVDFYVVKGLVEDILASFGLDEKRVMIKRSEAKELHPGRSADIYVGKDYIGFVGQIHPKMAKKYDVSETYVAQLNFTKLMTIRTSKVKFASIPLYPSVTRDIALVVKTEVPADDMIKAIKKAGKSIVKSSEVFDVYTGEHVEAGYKSVAIQITFQDATKTLKDEDISKSMESILSTLEKSFDAKLRG